MDLVLDFLHNKLKLNKEDKIVVGVSAGPDSMFLLQLLIELQHKINFLIIVAHINHNVRVESKEEEEFLKEYCRKFKVIFESRKITEYNKDNFHAYARDFRYKFYNELIEKYQANYLMTAHHGDDLIETILMRLTRGSTLYGYSGISLITQKDNYKIVRPLLYMTKDEIKEYNDNHNISYRIDKSNFSKKYTRNRYRMEVLPFLKLENKNVHLKFLKFSELLDSSNKYIEKDIEKTYNEVWENNKLNILKFQKYDNFLKRLVLEKILNIKLNDLREINDKHIDSLLKIIDDNKTGTLMNLPMGYVARISYNYLEIDKCEAKEKYYLELKDGLVLPNGMQFIEIKDCENGNDVLHLDSSLVSMPLYVRTRCDGDYIELKGMNGKRKINDIFIDCKIPRDNRNDYPIVVDSSNKIIWIPKLKKSKYDSKNNEKCDIIIKCL